MRKKTARESDCTLAFGEGENETYRIEFMSKGDFNTWQLYAQGGEKWIYKRKAERKDRLKDLLYKFPIVVSKVVVSKESDQQYEIEKQSQAFFKRASGEPEAWRAYQQKLFSKMLPQRDDLNSCLLIEPDGKDGLSDGDRAIEEVPFNIKSLERSYLYRWMLIDIDNKGTFQLGYIVKKHPGKTLYEVLKLYKEENSGVFDQHNLVDDLIKKILHAYRLGNMIDCSLDNIIYDDKTGQISFIDIEAEPVRLTCGNKTENFTASDESISGGLIEKLKEFFCSGCHLSGDFLKFNDKELFLQYFQYIDSSLKKTLTVNDLYKHVVENVRVLKNTIYNDCDLGKKIKEMLQDVLCYRQRELVDEERGVYKGDRRIVGPGTVKIGGVAVLTPKLSLIRLGWLLWEITQIIPPKKEHYFLYKLIVELLHSNEAERISLDDAIELLEYFKSQPEKISVKGVYKDICQTLSAPVLGRLEKWCDMDEKMKKRHNELAIMAYAPSQLAPPPPYVLVSFDILFDKIAAYEGVLKKREKLWAVEGQDASFQTMKVYCLYCICYLFCTALAQYIIKSYSVENKKEAAVEYCKQYCDFFRRTVGNGVPDKKYNILCAKSGGDMHERLSEPSRSSGKIKIFDGMRHRFPAVNGGSLYAAISNVEKNFNVAAIA